MSKQKRKDFRFQVFFLNRSALINKDMGARISGYQMLSVAKWCKWFFCLNYLFELVMLLHDIGWID